MYENALAVVDWECDTEALEYALVGEMGGGRGRADVRERVIEVLMCVGESSTNWSVSSKLTLDLADRERTFSGATFGVVGRVRDFVREEGVSARGCGCGAEDKTRDGGGRGVRSVGVRESLPGGRGRDRV